MTKLNSLGARIEPLDGPLPRMDFHWDAETEILSGTAADVQGERGLTGSIELEDARGAVVTLDFAGGAMRGVEVVVWPAGRTDERLHPPTPASTGRFVVPGRPSQPGVAVVEVDIALAVESSRDESVMHLRVGPRRGSTAVQLAENLLIEVDAEGEITGFWLLEVPAFPQGKPLVP
ncbi:MAG: hypothetical protein OER90_02730 [Gemmatimonadota bacterium]|nr:hypothetical protein [Gemmatimonadota bacterium]